MSRVIHIPQSIANSFVGQIPWENRTPAEEHYLLKAGMIGFPSSKNEYWKYTRIHRYIQRSYHLPVEGETGRRFVPCYFSIPAHITLINGVNVLLPDKEFIGNNFTGEIIREKEKVKLFHHLFETSKDIFPHLNAAFSSKVLTLRWRKKAQKNNPLLINIVSESETVSFPRIAVYVEKGASAEVIFNFESAGDNFLCLPLIEIYIEEDARFQNIILQKHTGENSALVVNLATHQQKNSFLQEHVFSFQGKLIRNNLNHYLAGEGAEAKLSGIYMTAAEDHIDNHTLIEHKVAHTFSNEKFKGIMGGRSKAVFNGRVLVHPEAQKIQAYQANDNIMLSPEAEINSKPELEIYADDVKCSHGSTVGKINEQALFYLRARGISRSMAERLLIEAFVAEVVETIHDSSTREAITDMIKEQITNMCERNGGRSGK